MIVWGLTINKQKMDFPGFDGKINSKYYTHVLQNSSTSNVDSLLRGNYQSFQNDYACVHITTYKKTLQENDVDVIYCPVECLDQNII